MIAPPAPLDFDFSGIRLRVRGLPGEIERLLREEWAGFEAAAPEAPFLDVAVRAGSEPEPRSPWDPKSMRSRLDPRSAGFRLEEGAIEVRAEGGAEASLRSAAGTRTFLALLNLIRAGLAWRMPSRGGALLHAAGLVVEGRAFLLVGPEGSGKTTWAGAGVEGGASLLGDDVVLVDRSRDGFEALAAPLRPRSGALRLPGRWPLAAILLPRHGAPARLGPAPAREVYARILANLPFVADAFGADERIPATIEDLEASVPARTLTFSPDPSFLPLLSGFGADLR